MGRPAPEKITSARDSMDAFTISAKVVSATMIFTPMMPEVEARAFSISRRRARTLASMGLEATSGSRMPTMAPAMTPMPPSSATAEARRERDMPTPIPPWTMGVRAMRSPIFSAGKDMERTLPPASGKRGGFMGFRKTLIRKSGASVKPLFYYDKGGGKITFITG